MKPSGGRPQRPAPSSTRRTHQCWPERPAESGAVLLWPLSGPRGTLPCLFSWSLVLGKRVVALREGLRPGRQRRCHELLGGVPPRSADGASAGDSLSHSHPLLAQPTFMRLDTTALGCLLWAPDSHCIHWCRAPHGTPGQAPRSAGGIFNSRAESGLRAVSAFTKDTQ